MVDQFNSTGEIDRRFEADMREVPAPQRVVVEPDSDLEKWQHERIIIHRAINREFLHCKDQDAGNMLLLYHFYYETGRRQRTNQPKATDKYCIKGLGWRKEKFHRVKNKLLDMKSGDKPLIEKVRRRKEGGEITGWYMKVNFMPSTKNITRTPAHSDSCEAQGPPDPQPVVDRTPNALSHQGIKCLNTTTDPVVVVSKKYGRLEIPLAVLKKTAQADIDRAAVVLEQAENVTSPTRFFIAAVNKGYQPEAPDPPRNMDAERTREMQRQKMSKEGCMSQEEFDAKMAEWQREREKSAVPVG